MSLEIFDFQSPSPCLLLMADEVKSFLEPIAPEHRARSVLDFSDQLLELMVSSKHLPAD